MSTLKAKNFHLIEDMDIAAGTYSLVERVEAIVSPVIGMLRLWTSRSRDRHQLAHMSDHMLQDIGLTRMDIDYEVAKHFWQK